MTAKYTLPSAANPANAWRMAAIALLAVRFVQGWIYWGGGTRRFIYGPQKLDPAGHWMAYKFQTAMPGALLGTDHLISYMLHHFTLLYIGVIVFSAIEMIAGFMLIAGLLTRLAAVASIGLSAVLMLLFGWQGATCIDEWTMASANFAMGITLFLAGSGAYSLDNYLLRRNSAFGERAWFRWLGGSLPLPLSEKTFKRLGLVLFWITVAWVVGTYSYYRGSVITPFHGGPVSPSKHHLSLSNAVILKDGSLRFQAYLDAGTPAEPSHILRIELQQTQDGRIVGTWDTRTLSNLPKKSFQNDYPYQQFAAHHFGIVAGVGAKAIITLPPINTAPLAAGPYVLRVTSVNDHVWTVPVKPVP
ncbi:MAG: TQO small subunit DoxD [Acidithiobacillus sp.]